MERTLLTAVLTIVAALACCIAAAQKKPLDHSVYDSWQSTGAPVLNSDGSIMAYTISPQEGDGELVIVNTDDSRELRIPRGGAPTISRDGRWAVFNIKAPFAATRQARIEKKKKEEMPGDTLGYVDLNTLQLSKIGDVTSFRSSLEDRNILAYEKNIDKKKVLVILNPATLRADTLRGVDKYSFDNTGKRLAVVFKKSKEDSLSADKVVLYETEGMQSEELSEGKKFYSAPKFNEQGDKLVFLASADSNDTGNKHCSVVFWEQLVSGKGRKAVTTTRVREIVSQDCTIGALCVTENANPRFSRLSGRLFLGISEYRPPKDTTIVDFETAQLDIWSYDIYMTPPMQKARAEQLRTATCSAVINLDSDDGIIPLSSSIVQDVRPIDGGEGEWALLLDNAAYQINSTWDSNDLGDVYLVNLRDGSRKQLFTALDSPSVSVSPGGKYLVWFSNEELSWMSMELSSGRTVNLTGSLDGVFYDDEDDHPSIPPAIDRPHWLSGDEAFLIAEKYDVWRIAPDGKSAICLTQGEGRKRNVELRYTDILKSRISRTLSEVGVVRTIGKDETVYLTTFDRKTKENGLATVSASKPGLKSFFLDKHSFLSVVKADDSPLIAFRRGDVKESPNIYTTTDLWANSKKWSSINPQQAEYNWADIQLVHWNAYDGTPLDGLLFTPEDLDPAKKYPMMVYFYETYSESLYSYFTVAPSRSTVNLPFYASRGYVVFVPDIVYKDGHPGESAYNCICSGAEAMCEQFPFIDRSLMAIQGQSWGGYQTAYLVTRTNMFAAAGAGAPVGNMTSAYGGVRWESGLVRAMQYEHGQSRIGKSLWDEGGLDLYIENSPIFHTQNVTTPVLIMHNDNDGAVPWYQGIEFFMALRRFQHPAWLLEYNNEAHNLNERRNSKDLSIRLQQFFDHYLKGEPMPAWMKTGVPTALKGEYFGFELTD